MSRSIALQNAILARRKEYQQDRLTRASLHANPFVQFANWFEQALASDILEPTTLQLATVTADGQPDIRSLLLREIDERGLVFYTNYTSAKGQQIAHNPKVALLFYWDVLERQVRIHGIAEKLPASDSATYFQSRPHESQLAALASQQSQPLANRASLLERWRALNEQYPQGSTVPAPAHWGGYRVRPQMFEFWQGGQHRLHDRFVYRLTDAQTWEITRLNP